MKSSYAGWVVAGLLLVLICTVGAMQQQGQVGRYQLVHGRYQFIDGVKGTNVTTDAVFRIDTVTGETRRFMFSVLPPAVPGGAVGTIYGWTSVIGNADEK